uniref:Tax1 (human T-cell leukemia virus type I) binding protein 1b n=1 Tax=Fundulus heteroclitus TaxID=8078 RepID=A0A3Q2PKB5_FUNHE
MEYKYDLTQSLFCHWAENWGWTMGTKINISVFLGYYVPNDDGEFYQFCYVTHKGEIRGASTPFQFRANSPSEDELLTVEDECNSDMLVVTTKAGLLEQKVEEAQREKDELLKNMALIQQEKEQLEAERDGLQKEFEQEKETCAQLRREIQEGLHSSQALQEEKEEVKRRLEEATARIVQLEEDLIGICIASRVCVHAFHFVMFSVHQIHLKNRELENTKLSAELQMLKSVDVNKENTIAQFKEEVGRLQTCLTEKEKQYKEVLAKVYPLALKEQLRQKEEQLQANQQQLSLLAAELRDASSTRDRTMSDLYHMKVEADALRQAKAEAQAQCVRLELMVDQTTDTKTDTLQREVEDLKLRLLMAADHYKEKYKECQRLQKQVFKLSEQQGVRLQAAYVTRESATRVRFYAEIFNKHSREATDRNDRYRKCRQMLMEEKERSSTLADELAKTELKLKEQLKTNESLKLHLAAAEDRYKEIQKSSGKKGDQGASEKSSSENLQTSVPLILQYPVPYAPDTPTPLLVSQSPSKLHFGNPYSISDSKDETEEEFSDNQPLKLPPVGPPSWDSNVVCIQPARNLSRPEGHEEAEENNNVSASSERPLHLFKNRTLFTFPVVFRCPLCEVIFPPNYDQSKFEEHVESHWKICPMCSEQFPLDCDQKVFENHVLTHFDGHTLNFD